MFTPRSSMLSASVLFRRRAHDPSAVVVVENHVGHIALVESVTVDNFLVFHAVALP